MRARPGDRFELLGELPGDAGVLAHHAVDVPVPGEHELERDSKPVQRRVARPDQPECGGSAACAPELVIVLPRLQRDVVAEPFRLFVGVGMTAHIDEQRRVVDVGALLFVQPDSIGEPERDQALPQHVLHRLTESEVDTERQRRDELRQADGRAIGIAAHGRSLRLAASSVCVRVRRVILLG